MLARLLGAGGYGVVAVAVAVLLYLNYLADCGVEVLGVREVAAHPETVDRFVPPILALRLAFGAALALVCITVGLGFMPQPDGAILAVYSLTLLAVGGNTRWVHLGLEQAGYAALARAVGEATMLLLVLALLRGPGDLGRVPLAQFSGDMAGALLLAWGLARAGYRLRLRWAPREAARVVRPAVWLAGNAVVGLVIYNSDLIFLRVFRSAREVGQYAAAYTLISFLLNLGVTYGQSLLPTLTRLHPTPEERGRLYHSALVQVFAGALPVAVGGTLLAGGLLGLVFGSQYLAAGTALIILLWSIPVAFFRNVPQTALIVAGRQEWVFRVTLAAALFNLGLNFAMVPRWGMLGAAAATLATEAVRTAGMLLLAGRVGYPGPGPIRFWRVAVSSGVMAAVLLSLRPASVLLLVPVGMAVYGTTLLLVGGLRFRPGLRPELRL